LKKSDELEEEGDEPEGSDKRKKNKRMRRIAEEI
jgi:hypothetical protein